MDTLWNIVSNNYVSTVLIGIVLPWLIYKYSTRNHDYWRKKGIPHAKPLPFIGTLYEGFRKNFEIIECENYFKYGRLYGLYEANKPVLTIGDPELIKNILVKDFQHFMNRRKFETGDPVTDKMLTILEGEDWKRVRTIVSPTFSTGKIKRVLKIFRECSKTVVQNLKNESEKSNSVDVLRLYGAFTMDVIASSAFSTKIDSHNDPENIFVKMARRAFTNGFSIKMIIFFLFPRVMKLLRGTIFDKQSGLFFKNITLEIIEERKRTGQTRDDFLQLLMDTATEVAKEEKWEEKSDDIIANYGDAAVSDSIFKGSISKHLSKDELVAQCVIFFLAGYHTTAVVLSITTYLLAIHQNEQDRLFKEICEVLSETDGELTYEAVQKMKHLDNVISESARMYSPFIRLERTTDIDYSLGDTGITIPKGTTIGVPVYAMHRDPQFFPEPDKFIPDRFTPEGREKQIPYSYLPFGAGPRNCVGMRFALMELKTCLIHVFSSFKVQLSPETKVPVEFINGVGLLSPKPIHLNLEERTNCPLKF